MWTDGRKDTSNVLGALRDYVKGTEIGVEEKLQELMRQRQ